jgi:hypothetical protein
MRSLNNIDDNLYIQCNPVKVDNNGVIEETTNSNSASTVASIITEGADFFSQENLYSNVTLTVFLSLLLVYIIYAAGQWACGGGFRSMLDMFNYVKPKTSFHSNK